MSNLKNKTISGIKWVSFSSILIASLQMIQLIVLSRELQVEEFGIWAIVSLIIFYSNIFSDLGVSAAVIHFQDTNHYQLSTLYWVNIFTSLFLFVLIFVLSPMLLTIFNLNNYKTLFIVASLSLPFSASGILFQNLFQKEMQFNLLAKIETISVFCGVSTAIVLAYLDFGVWSFVSGFLMNVVLKSFSLSFWGWRKYNIKVYFNLNKVKKYLKFGFYQIGEKSINVLNQRFDQLILGVILGTEQLGYYNLAFNLVSKPMVILNPIFTRVAFPLFAKIQNEEMRLRRTYLKLIKIISSINSVIYWLVFILAPVAVPYFLGEKWNNSIILIQILSGVAFLRSVANPVGSLVLSKGRADLGFKWNFALSFITLPIVYLTGKHFGTEGIAFGLLFIQIVLFFPNYIFLVKPFIGKVINNYTVNIFKTFAFAMLMLLSLFLVEKMYLTNPLYIIFAQLILSLIIYFVLIFIFERKLINELIELLKK